MKSFGLWILVILGWFGVAGDVRASVVDEAALFLGRNLGVAIPNKNFVYRGRLGAGDDARDCFVETNVNVVNRRLLAIYVRILSDRRLTMPLAHFMIGESDSDNFISHVRILSRKPVIVSAVQTNSSVAVKSNIQVSGSAGEMRVDITESNPETGKVYRRETCQGLDFVPLTET